MEYLASHVLLSNNLDSCMPCRSSATKILLPFTNAARATHFKTLLVRPSLTFLRNKKACHTACGSTSETFRIPPRNEEEYLLAY